MKKIILLALLALLPASAMAQQAPTRILVVYYSETGNTQGLAKSVRDGAASVAAVEVLLRKVSEASDEEILAADGIALGTPVHWANLSANAKRFLDRVAEVFWKKKTTGEGRTAAAFCTGGAVAAGKDLARLSILAAFLEMRFLVMGGVDAEGFGTLGAQATTGPDDPGLSEKELAEARRFGERFARLTRHISLRLAPTSEKPEAK